MSFAQYEQACARCGEPQKVVLIGGEDWVNESKEAEIICRQCAYGLKPTEDGRDTRNPTEALRHRPFFDISMERHATPGRLGGGPRRD